MTIHELNVARLGDYLATAWPDAGKLISAEKFPGGQSNPTYKLHTASGNYVLRRKPPGALLKSAHAVDREFRVLEALANTDVPVAKVFHLCDDDSVIGSMFYVMEFVEGDVHWDPSLPGMASEKRALIYEEMNRVIAAIHSVDLEATGLGDFGSPGNYYERQFSRWSKQYRASETDRIDEMEDLIAWLEPRIPADDGKISLVHGDYRIDNIMFARGQTQARAVMDWELSTLGHPFADLAYQCMLWRLPGHLPLKGLGGVNLDETGIPSERAYVEEYCARVGLDEIPNWDFYVAFGAFRLAAIVQGVRKRAIDGNASSAKALEVGQMVRPLAQLGLGREV